MNDEDCDEAAPTPDYGYPTRQSIDGIRAAAHTLRVLIEQWAPTRSRSLALTKLDECMLWTEESWKND